MTTQCPQCGQPLSKYKMCEKMWSLSRRAGIYGIRPLELKRTTTKVVPQVGPLQRGPRAVPKAGRQTQSARNYAPNQAWTPDFQRSNRNRRDNNNAKTKAHQVHGEFIPYSICSGGETTTIPKARNRKQNRPNAQDDHCVYHEIEKDKRRRFLNY